MIVSQAGFVADSELAFGRILDEACFMAKDPLALRRIDHVRFFVGNARQSAYFYRNAFGFEVLGYAGLETGVKARGRLCPAAGPDHLRADFAADQPTIPKAIACTSTATASWTSPSTSRTCAAAYEEALRRGARGRHAAAGPRRRLSASSKPRPSAPTATPPTASSTAIAIAASSLRVISRSTPTATARSPSMPSAWPPSTTSSATSRKAR